MDNFGQFDLLGSNFDFLFMEKNDILTEHNYCKSPVADDINVAEKEEEQVFETIESDRQV